MNLKEAVKAAKATIIDLYSDEKIDEVGLEEIVFNEQRQSWRVTIGFLRPWMKTPAGPLSNLIKAGPPRWYKVVEISSVDGSLVSITDRGLATAA